MAIPPSASAHKIAHKIANAHAADAPMATRALTSSVSSRAAARRYLDPEDLHHFLYILPHPSFFARAAEQVCRMERRHQLDPAHFVPVAAQPTDWRLDLEQRLHRKSAESDDRARAHEIYLAHQERLARRDLVGLGIAIVGRAALDDVADIDVGALEP